MKIGPIFITWHQKKDLSDKWLLDDTPRSIEELHHFENPELLLSSQDTRNVLENFDYRQDIIQKSWFSKFSYAISLPWCALLIFVIAAQGYEGGWGVESAEFIAIVTTTTASVFGFAYVLGRYLYGSKAYQSKTSAQDSAQSDGS
ncbi:MAG: hypothetical protein R3C97_04235 [Geminicoccaceae bacterium]